MEFAAFERLVLRVLFETDQPLTIPHLAYLAGISVGRAERYLGRMVEQGTVVPRLGPGEVVEYIFAGRRDLAAERKAAEAGWRSDPHDTAEEVPLPGRQPAQPEDQDATAATAVLLSVLVPGAGHIYSGRSGAGVAWMATTLAGYACCLLPGLFLHGLCLVSAAHARQLQ